MKEQREKAKKFVFIRFFLSFLLPPAHSDFTFIERSLTLLPLPAHMQVKFCSCQSRRSWEQHLCFFFSDASEFPSLDEEAAAPDGKRLAEAAWTLVMSVAVVRLFLISCVVATFVPAGWSEETQGSYRNDLIITDTAVAEAPQSPDKIHILSVFRHVCYIIE